MSTDLLVIIESHWFIFMQCSYQVSANFTNNLRKAFLYQSYTTSFLYFQFMFLFYPKFGGKINHVKLVQILETLSKKMQNGLSHF